MTCRQSGQALTISWVPPRSALMEKIDENMDGKISAAEFMTWVRERHVQEYRDTAISQVQTAAPRGKAGFLVPKTVPFFHGFTLGVVENPDFRPCHGTGRTQSRSSNPWQSFPPTRKILSERTQRVEM